MTETVTIERHAGGYRVNGDSKASLAKAFSEAAHRLHPDTLILVEVTMVPMRPGRSARGEGDAAARASVSSGRGRRAVQSGVGVSGPSRLPV